MKKPPEAREALLRVLKGQSLEERLLTLSEGFVNTPYVESPLGEGLGKDPDPLLRYDAVDCLTFVEESMALALAQAPGEVLPLLSQLRYDGPVAYETRNHLMEAQWLPANTRKGFLKDVTRVYGGEDTTQVSKTLSASTWAMPFAKKMDLPPGHRPTGTYSVDVIPLAKVAERTQRVPEGTLMLVVRADRVGRPTRVTHLGFLVRKAGKLHLRHAAKSVFARVVDEELTHFLKRNARYDAYPVVGVSLYEIHSPVPRAVADTRP
jgi:hypothetical protein